MIRAAEAVVVRAHRARFRVRVVKRARVERVVLVAPLEWAVRMRVERLEWAVLEGGKPKMHYVGNPPMVQCALKALFAVIRAEFQIVIGSARCLVHRIRPDARMGARCFLESAWRGGLGGHRR